LNNAFKEEELGQKELDEMSVSTRLAHKFWAPFIEGKVGAQTRVCQYALASHWDTRVLCPDLQADALCDNFSWCGYRMVTSPAADRTVAADPTAAAAATRKKLLTLMEDYWIMVLTGFDVTKVDLAANQLELTHARPFVSWARTDKTLTLPFTCDIDGLTTSSTSAIGAADAADTTTGATNADDLGPLATSLHFKADLGAALLKAGCPPEIAAMTTNPEAMKMLVVLRRANVKSQVVTYNALKSASRKQETWCSALGIL
jgi:hypothetical protein